MKRIFGILHHQQDEKLRVLTNELDTLQRAHVTQEQRLVQLEQRLAQVGNWAADPTIQLTRVRAERLSEVLPAPSELQTEAHQSLLVKLASGRTLQLDVPDLARKDPWPIPATFDREGYFGEHHFNFWISGLVDFVKVRDSVEEQGIAGDICLLDIGCASGRFLRHPAAQQKEWRLIGCDIDAMNIAWVKTHLPESITAFQNTVYPHLPLPDASVDVVTAFSVFTHLDKLEDAWLLEIHRILKPGGLFYVTAHTERVWARIADRPHALEPMLKCRSEWSFPKGITISEALFRKAMPEDFLILRFQEAGAYVSQTFHSDRYIRTNWGRIFDVLAIHDAYNIDFQDVILLRKRP